MKKRLLRIIVGALLLCFTGCSMQSEQHTIEQTFVGKAATMEDGETVFLWKNVFGQEIYKLSQEQELLNVENWNDPSTSIVGEVEGLNGLSEEAQQKVRLFFESIKNPIDVHEYIKEAYTRYRENVKKNEESDFQPLYISHHVIPTGEAEKVSAFCSISVIPSAFEQKAYTENRESYFFDRVTGEPMEVWDLFSIPMKDVKEYIFSLSAEDPQPISEEMKEELTSKNFFLFNKNLQIYFPERMIDGVYYLGEIYEYDYDELKEIMNEWAIPEKKE